MCFVRYFSVWIKTGLSISVGHVLQSVYMYMLTFSLTSLTAQCFALFVVVIELLPKLLFFLSISVSSALNRNGEKCSTLLYSLK